MLADEAKDVGKDCSEWKTMVTANPNVKRGMKSMHFCKM